MSTEELERENNPAEVKSKLTQGQKKALVLYNLCSQAETELASIATAIRFMLVGLHTGGCVNKGGILTEQERNDLKRIGDELSAQAQTLLSFAEKVGSKAPDLSQEFPGLMKTE